MKVLIELQIMSILVSGSLVECVVNGACMSVPATCSDSTASLLPVEERSLIVVILVVSEVLSSSGKSLRSVVSIARLRHVGRKLFCM